jgi:hypothetical protein
VVAACGYRHNSRLVQPGVECVDLRDDVIEIERADQRYIANVGDARQFERNDLCQRVVVEDIARLVADFAWAMSSASALGQTNVSRQAEKRDVNFRPVVAKVCAEESGDARICFEIHEFAVGAHSFGHFVVARVVHRCLHCVKGAPPKSR